MTLRVDWATHKSARYAVENWHYSRRMPMPPLVKLGAWENGRFVGVVLFGRGANAQIGKAYNLRQTEVCELVRVALRKHSAPVSQICARAIKFLRKVAPGLRLLVSYADPSHGHVGGIYQAMNWSYVGLSQGGVEYFHEGRWKHSREVLGGAFGGKAKIRDRSALKKRKTPGKHKYLLALDQDMASQIEALAKPYPKKTSAPESSTRHGSPVEVGGATPTSALKNKSAKRVADG